MTTVLILLLFFGLAPNVFGISMSRENRATRMSVVEFWKNETAGDGLNLRIAHGVNSWPALVDQLHEPFLNKSLMIEGDVFMHQHRRPRHKQAIPIMRAPPRVADRITFKEWLREVGSLRKAIKINFRSTEVVRPVLQTLYAAQDELRSPVILHANVFRSPRSIENEVDPAVFVEKTQSLFPDATLSLGWTKNNFSDLSTKYKKMTWREVFEILEYVANLEQPVMLSVRLSVAANSRDELLWLLGMEKSVSLLIWSDEEDQVTDWTKVADIRRAATRNRVLYDLLPEHKQRLQDFEFIPPSTFHNGVPWTTNRLEQCFQESSKAVEAQPSLDGRVGNFFRSLSHRLSRKVHFMPKRVPREVDIDEDSGLSVMLLDKLNDADRPEMAKGVQVWHYLHNRPFQIFIGYDGRVWIENKGRRPEGYDVKSMGRLPHSHCYSFRVVDRGWRVHAAVWKDHCSEHPHRSRRHKEERVEPLILDLDTPFQQTSRSLRHVVVSKTGDGAVDFMMPELRHSGAAAGASLLALLLLFLLSLVVL